ncbi:MAG: phosphohydrolase [Anaerolineae bacterium]|nr:phosphohydrolase [Anaerolineae bacterium]
MSKLAASNGLNLYYHGIHHTRDDVLPAAERLGQMAHLSDNKLLTLCTGALYHDVGCLTDIANHEAISVALARQTLPGFGYTPEQIEAIAGIIMATRLPQEPHSFLEELMCDADLDSLGREDFFIRSHQLRLELKMRGQCFSIRDWYQGQLVFLENHSYFTDAAHNLRDAGKCENIRELKEVLCWAEAI